MKKRNLLIKQLYKQLYQKKTQINELPKPNDINNLLCTKICITADFKVKLTVSIQHFYFFSIRHSSSNFDILP